MRIRWRCRMTLRRRRTALGTWRITAGTRWVTLRTRTRWWVTAWTRVRSRRMMSVTIVYTNISWFASTSKLRIIQLSHCPFHRVICIIFNNSIVSPNSTIANFTNCAHVVLQVLWIATLFCPIPANYTHVANALLPLYTDYDVEVPFSPVSAFLRTSCLE